MRVTPEMDQTVNSEGSIISLTGYSVEIRAGDIWWRVDHPG